MQNKIIELIKLSFIPFSIISPIPFFSCFLFLIATKYSEMNVFDFFLLFIGIIITLLSSGASNFWNHTNDIKEDIKNNKNNVLIQNIISQNSAILISIILYSISIILVFLISIYLNRPVYFYFLIWVIITWWYSDNFFLKRIVRFRLKTHYLGEIFTYSIAYPAYTMSIWLIFSDSITKGIVLSFLFLCFGIAGVLLKDLKDIKGDREAGLKTFGVMFAPSKLIHLACIFLIFYFFIILIATSERIFNPMSVIIVIPFIYLIDRTYLHFSKKNWKLEIGDQKNIKSMIMSVYSSLFLLGFTNFI
ncbi:MAG: UbiA family prenyltransferase [Methanosarcinales archaeon]|nr:UbiA family prenyltransferase [Methanosarcinales archaeon]